MKKFWDIMSVVGIVNLILIFIRLLGSFIINSWDFNLGVDQFKLLIVYNIVMILVGLFVLGENSE